MVFSISVIIPVYNGEPFIEKAIHSAKMQPEVFEIVVVNDGSTDGTQEILNRLKKSIIKLKVYHHSNKINRGRSASRNLGIKQAFGNYIAFLDADDYYLDNRFENDQIIFKNNKYVDGVYNAIGVKFYREADQNEKKQLKLTTVKEPINSSELFETLLLGSKGYFSIDGLTVKKSIFNKIGYFNDKLVVAEDTDLILKMALKCRLEAGIIDKPLAIRGVHTKNVFNQVNVYKKHRSNMYESVINWGIKEKISFYNLDQLLKWLWYYRNKGNNNQITELNYWFKLVCKNPSLLSSKLGYKYFPIIRQRKKLFPILFR